MIVNKNSLLVSLLADKSIPVLGNIHVLPNGTTMASNGRAILFVEGVKEKVKESLTLKETKGESVTLPLEVVNEMIKSIPRDGLFKGLLEHADVDVKREVIVVTTTDGKRNRLMEFKVYLRKWIDFKSVVRYYARGTRVTEVLLNRKRLLGLLETIDKVCPDSSGEAVIAIEIKDNGVIAVRGENRRTGQSVLGIINVIKGVWDRNKVWERVLGQ